MTLENRWRMLQLFADGGGAGGSSGAGAAAGGEGGAAATSGEGSADAAQALRNMGVPEVKLAKYAKAYQKRANRQASAAPTAEANAQAAAATNGDTQAEAVKPAYNWDEVMKDPEMNRRMQDVVKASKKKSQAAEDALSALAPALKAQAEEFGLDPENIDYAALGKYMSGEYEQKALETGLSRETVASMDKQQRINSESMARQHIQKLIAQGEEMKKVFPNFDLREEMKNPAFVRLTSQGVNVSVEDAFYLVHRKELEQRTAQVVERKATQRVQNAVKAGAARPTENGSSAQSPSVTTIDWKHASREQLDAQKKAIRLAAAQGRKLMPGR